MSPPAGMKKPLRRGNGEGAADQAATKQLISDRSLPMTSNASDGKAFIPGIEGVKVSIQFITPEHAAELLARNHNNRSVKKANLLKIKTALESGRYEFNGESLVLDEDGGVLDGQHRLIASHETGVGFWTVLVEGMPRKVMPTINTGSSRTAGDAVKIAGRGSSAEAAVVAQIIRIEKLGLEKSFGRGPERSKALVTEIVERLETEPALYDLVADARRIGRECGLTARIAGSMYWYLSQIDKGDADDFFGKLASGAGMQEGHPCLTLRNSLMKRKAGLGTQSVDSEQKVVAVIVKAWNKYRTQGQLKVTRIRRNGRAETFPVAI